MYVQVRVYSINYNQSRWLGRSMLYCYSNTPCHAVHGAVQWWVRSERGCLLSSSPRCQVKG